MRRRRRRDALRLQLVRVFDIAARQGTFARASAIAGTGGGGVLTVDSGAGPGPGPGGGGGPGGGRGGSGPGGSSGGGLGLSSTFTDYIDGARLYLESESTDKEIAPSVKEIKSYFSSFVRSLVGSFSREYLELCLLGVFSPLY